MSDLEKIKFHLKMIGETLDSREYPIQSLVITMDWNESDLNRAHDIFEKYDSLLEEGAEINWTQFEMELRDTFEIGYQTVKTVVLAFFRNYQWMEVCTQYALSHMCAEFDEIARAAEGGT